MYYLCLQFPLSSEEVCVLSASGTAAIVKLQPNDPADAKELDHKRDNARTDVISRQRDEDPGEILTQIHVDRFANVLRDIIRGATRPRTGKSMRLNAADCAGSRTSPTARQTFRSPSNCPAAASAGIYFYSHSCSFLEKKQVFISVNNISCRSGKVPDVMIATIEPPIGVGITGRGCLIQARLCRLKRDESRGDQQAKEVSDGLPFLEYELHRQLINKLRIKGMNAIFGLKVSLETFSLFFVHLNAPIDDDDKLFMIESVPRP